MTLSNIQSGQCFAFGTLCSYLYEELHTQPVHAYLEPPFMSITAIRIRRTCTCIKHIQVHLRGHTALEYEPFPTDVTGHQRHHVPVPPRASLFPHRL